MNRRITFSIVVIILLGGGTWWFIHTKRARTPIADGINAIPADAALILESRRSPQAWKKLSQTNIMWEELLGTELIHGIDAQATSIDSALQLNANIAAMLDDHPAYLSLHCRPKNSIQALYVCALPDLTWQEQVEEFLEASVNKSKPVYTAEYIGETRIGVLQISEGKLLYFAIASGILIMSSHDELLRESIRHLQAGSTLAKEEYFSRVKSASGENVDANVYVNYKMFPALFAGLLNEGANEEAKAFGSFAEYSGWDISLKPNEVIMSGFTSPGTKSFLARFKDQKPQEIELPRILPSGTSAMLFYGLSNPGEFIAGGGYHSVNSSQKRADLFAKVGEHSAGKDPRELLTSWMGNEIAFVLTEAKEDRRENTYAVIGAGNINKAIGTLSAIADSLKSKNSEDTINYQKHCIRHLDLPGMLPDLLGSTFKSIQENYFTAVDNYVVFANSAQALKNFIDDFESNRTLVNNKNYKAFAEKMSAEANIFLYSCIARSSDLYASFLTEENAYDLRMQDDLMKKFEALGFQFSAGNKLFYSNIYLKYNPEQKQETSTIWESQLDTTLSSRPYLLHNHNTQAKEVLVQDDANKIYLISNTGKVIWTKQLQEKIMSDVIQVDVLKNDKLQMVFNTNSFIYMYDRNGNEMPGFPLKLRAPATNALSVIDYEKNRDYRIFIATANKRIVCYKANGEQVTAFAFDKTENPVFLPLQYFSAANKDHLCAIDMKGKIYILDRHGKERVKLKENMPQGMRNFYVEAGKDYNHSSVTGADTLGNVVRISLAGKKENISFQSFETTPFFEMRDLNNDKTREFIFLTRNELKVFAQDRSLLFKFEFPEMISQPPLFFLFPDNTGKIGVISELSNELFLFNENGSLFTNFPLAGKTPFSIGDLNNEGHFNLVAGSAENSIFVYQLK